MISFSAWSKIDFAFRPLRHRLASAFNPASICAQTSSDHLGYHTDHSRSPFARDSYSSTRIVSHPPHPCSRDRSRPRSSRTSLTFTLAPSCFHPSHASPFRLACRVTKLSFEFGRPALGFKHSRSATRKQQFDRKLDFEQLAVLGYTAHSRSPTRFS